MQHFDIKVSNFLISDNESLVQRHTSLQQEQQQLQIHSIITTVASIKCDFTSPAATTRTTILYLNSLNFHALLVQENNCKITTQYVKHNSQVPEVLLV